MDTENVEHLFEIVSHNPSFNSVREKLGWPVEPLDFCVPSNPYFPPEELVDDIRIALPNIMKYYPDYAESHQLVLSGLIDIAAENIVVANGSTELITLLCSYCKGPIATSVPTFGRWTDLPMEYEVPMYFIRRDSPSGFSLTVEQIIANVRRNDVNTLVLSNPNNPTGQAIGLTEIKQLVAELDDLALIVIDESFLDFSDISSAAQLATLENNVIVIKSLGKSLGWHGLRLGYAVSDIAQARHLRSRLPYWNVNGLAAFVLHRVQDYSNELEGSFEHIKRDRAYFTEQLSAVEHLRVFTSQANFVYVELPEHTSGQRIRNTLLGEYGMLVRECSNKIGSSERYMRLAVRGQHESDALVRALRNTLDQPH